ncbi:MAG: hypothetical protein H6613_18635 [Ignavibacteriales bacterium]|nr:hypothetical protein [Ignavibacteriales bacterium]
MPSEYYNQPEKFDFLTSADVDSMKRSYFDTVELFTAKSAYPKIDTLKL